MYNVLIVDDEEGIRDVLQQILSRSGYHAEIAAGGHEGIQMLDTTPFRRCGEPDGSSSDFSARFPRQREPTYSKRLRGFGLASEK